MSFFENTRKPVGLGGKIMVAMMNVGHSAMAAWGLRFLQPDPDAMVLDCGCGGGANIKTLLKLCPNGKVQGIDYSAVSVEGEKLCVQGLREKADKIKWVKKQKLIGATAHGIPSPAVCMDANTAMRAGLRSDLAEQAKPITTRLAANANG